MFSNLAFNQNKPQNNTSLFVSNQSLFNTNNLENQNKSLFVNSPDNSIFGINNKTKTTSLFNNDSLFNKNIESNSLFNDGQKQSNISLFSNISQINQTGNNDLKLNLFKESITTIPNIFTANNNNQTKSLFDDLKVNQQNSIFTNNNDNLNKGLFNNSVSNKIELKEKSLFENYNFGNFENKNIQNNPNQKYSLFDNDNKNSLFSGISINKNGGLLEQNTLNQKSLFNNNITFFEKKEIKNNEGNPFSFNTSNTLFNNNNNKEMNPNNDNKSLFAQKNENIGILFNFSNNNDNKSNFHQTNNNSPNTLNINNNTNNFTNQNSFINSFNTPYNQGNNLNKDNLMDNDVLDPFNYISSEHTKELFTQYENLNKKIMETIEKRKSYEKFMEELEQKYNNKENIDNNLYILDEYEKNNNNQNELVLSNEKYNSSYKKPTKRNYYEEKNKVFNMENMSKTISKVNSIYEEYESLKSQYKSNLRKKNLNIFNSNIKVNSESIIKKQETNKDEENIILGRNKVLFQKNINEFNNLTNNVIQINDNEKSEIMNNKSEKANNSQKNIDIPTQKEKNEEKNNNNKNNELVPIELIPKLTKEGYKCIPSILELSRMTKEELKKVEGFKIYNQYGEVEFKEPVNLLGLDLDKLVDIEKNMIDTGDELDYCSKFKLYNFKVEENGLNKYKISLEKAGGNFLGYKNNEMIWEYKKKERA